MISSLSYKTMSSFILEDQLQGLQTFLENDHINIDDCDDNGQTSLMLSCELGKYVFVQKLISLNADVNLEDNDNRTALIIAAREGHDKIISLLLGNSALIEHRDNNLWTALLWASYKGHEEAVKVLLHASADPNAHGQYNLSCLAWASGRNFPQIVKDLIGYGAKVNKSDKYGTTPLIWACRKGSMSIVEELLRAGANVDTSGMHSWTPLLVAAAGNFTDIAVNLLDHSKNNVNAINNNGFTALALACKHGNSTVVKSLLNCGAYVNLTDRGGDTNLIHAVKNGHTEVVSTLIQKYADVNVHGADKKTALYWAAEKSNVQIAKILLSANPDVDSPNQDWDTPLIRATRNRVKELVTILLDKNAKVHIADRRGDTALHVAMRCQSKGIVEILLQNPKNSRLLYKANKIGETPYSLDSTHHRSILANIFGARRLNTNTNSENLLGYDLYSGCLADILSEPSLSMPICVGLYAKWGSGKSFLLDKLQDEMRSFSSQSVTDMFSFSWNVILLNSQISLLLGILVGFATHSLWAGVAVAISTLLMLFGFLSLVWFGCNRFSWSWCDSASIFIASKLQHWKLLFEVLFCHPPDHRNEWQMQSIRFLFTCQTKASITRIQLSTTQIIRSLYEVVEAEWGWLVPRLYTVFKPSITESGKRKLRRCCFLPTVLLVGLVYICIVSSVIVLSIISYELENDVMSTVKLPNGTAITKTYQRNVDIDSGRIYFLIFMGCFIVLLFLTNIRTVFNVCSSLIFQIHYKYRWQRKNSEFSKSKSNEFFQDVRKSVDEISNLVKCMDGFTGRRTRIVIVVDGLDSCEQDKVLHMLDTVRILFSDQNSPFVTLLAIDPHVIIKAIEANICQGLSDTPINGRDYLNNIIHLPFFLQNSGLRGVEVARLTAQSHRKESIINAEENFKQNKRDSIVSTFSINDSMRSKKPFRLRIKEAVSGLDPSSGGKKSYTGAHDLTKVLLNDDYFSDVNPRSMRKLMNVVYVTGRLMKAFNIDFNWYHMASWVNITEQWPYRTSWIIFYFESHEKELEDDISLKFIFDKVINQIPASREAEPMLEMDRNSRKLELFLKYHSTSLKVADLKIFRPFTINLDPYILKIIKENVKNIEEAKKFDVQSIPPHNGDSSMVNPPYHSLYSKSNSLGRNTSFQHYNNPFMFGDHNTGQDKKWAEHASMKKIAKLIDVPVNKKLSDMSTDDVCQLLPSIKGITDTRLQKYREILKENNISGLVLLSCELSDLKNAMTMTFGDWELFRQIITLLKEKEYSLNSSIDSIDPVMQDKHKEKHDSHSKFGKLNVRNLTLKSVDKKNLTKKQDCVDKLADMRKSSDHLTKQITLEETMIVDALQTFNQDAMEDTLSVQRQQDKTSQKVSGFNTSLSIIGSDEGEDQLAKETEIIFIASSPPSPKYRSVSLSLISKQQSIDVVPEELVNSHTLTNLQSICRDYHPSHSNKASKLLLPNHHSSVEISDEQTDIQLVEMPFSTYASLEQIHYQKNKNKSITISKSCVHSEIEDSIDDSASLLPNSSNWSEKKDDLTSLLRHSSVESLKSVANSPSLSSHTTDQTMPYCNRPSRPTLVRQYPIDSISSSQSKNFDHYEEEDKLYQKRHSIDSGSKQVLWMAPSSSSSSIIDIADSDDAKDSSIVEYV